MLVVIALLLIIALFGGGFAWNVLWAVAAVVLVVWLLGYAFHGPSHRWYRW